MIEIPALFAKQFEEMEKARVKQEALRLAKKHEKQLDDLHSKHESIFRELEQVHVSSSALHIALNY